MPLYFCCKDLHVLIGSYSFVWPLRDISFKEHTKDLSYWKHWVNDCSLNNGYEL